MKLRIGIVFLFLPLLFFSQGGFKRQFNLPGVVSNHSKGIYQKPNGDYIAGGIVIDTLQGFSFNRLAIMGLDANGQLQWSKKYGDLKFEYLAGMGSPWFYYDGTFLYHAGSVRDSNNKYIGVFIKFDQNGDTVWQKRFYDTLQYVIPQMVTKSVDNGFLITGFFASPMIINSPMMIIKTNSSGIELWRKKIHKSVPDAQEGKAILQDSASKKIVIVGNQAIGNSTNWWFYDNVLILDSLGNNLSQHHFTGSTGGALVDLIQTKDGKFVAVGNSISSQQVGSTNLVRSFAVKFDVNTPSPPIWKFLFDKLEFVNVFTYINELDNGDMMLGGTIDTLQLFNQTTNALIRLTRINKNGIVKWNKYYNYKFNAPNSDNNMGIWCLNPTSDKGYIAAIEVSNNPNPNPFFFVKFDSTGCDSTEEYCKLMAEVGVNEFNSQDINFRVYPNPAFNHIYFDLADIKKAELLISSLLGELLIQVPGYESKTPVSLETIEQGLYIYQLRSNGVVRSGKFLKE